MKYKIAEVEEVRTFKEMSVSIVYEGEEIVVEAIKKFLQEDDESQEKLARMILDEIGTLAPKPTPPPLGDLEK